MRDLKISKCYYPEFRNLISEIRRKVSKRPRCKSKGTLELLLFLTFADFFYQRCWYKRSYINKWMPWEWIQMYPTGGRMSWTSRLWLWVGLCIGGRLRKHLLWGNILNLRLPWVEGGDRSNSILCGLFWWSLITEFKVDISLTCDFKVWSSLALNHCWKETAQPQTTFLSPYNF